MHPEFVAFVGALLGLLVSLLVLNALLTCARELKAIRSHLDRLAPEALLHLKTARRNAVSEPGEDENVAPKDSYTADPKRWLADRGSRT